MLTKFTLAVMLSFSTAEAINIQLAADLQNTMAGADQLLAQVLSTTLEEPATDTATAGDAPASVNADVEEPASTETETETET